MPSHPSRWSAVVGGFLLFSFVVFSLGCSETTEPVGVDPPLVSDDEQEFEGSIDPELGTFVLRSIEIPTPGPSPIRVRLIGKDLRVDPATHTVEILVAIENQGRDPLYPRILAVIYDLNPQVVRVLNADETNCPDDSTAARRSDCRYLFEYSSLLGDDNVLESGEISEFKPWRFQVPGLGGFSFAATVRVGRVPESARIGGLFFADTNENGRPDPDEIPMPGGAVRAVGPSGQQFVAEVGHDGRYAFAIEVTGLYTVQAIPPPSFAPLRFTTPNPLEVIILPDSAGNPQSFGHANFGLVNADIPGVPPPVRFFDGPRDSLPLDRYDLGEVKWDDRYLRLRVGFSGCDDRQHFQLFMMDSFMESNPVQALLLLAHDSNGQLCAAYFQRDLVYDLQPIRERYRREYGAEGSILLQYEDWTGEVHRFEMSAGLR